MRFGQWNGTDLNRISQTRLQTNDFIYIKASAPLHFKEFYTNAIQLNSQFVNYVLCSSQKYYTFNVPIVKDLMTRAWKIRPVFRRRKLRNGKSYLDQYLLLAAWLYQRPWNPTEIALKASLQKKNHSLVFYTKWNASYWLDHMPNSRSLTWLSSRRS